MTPDTPRDPEHRPRADALPLGAVPAEAAPADGLHLDADGPSHLPAWEEFALDYLDGRLDASGIALVDAHLATCAACRRDLDVQRSVRAALAGSRMVAPPSALEEAVLSRVLGAGQNAPPEHVPTTGIDGRRARRAWISGLLRPRVWMPAAAALFLVLALLSQYHPNATRVALDSSKNGLTATTAAAAMSAPVAPGTGRQSDQTAAGEAATSTTMPASTPVTTAASGSISTPSTTLAAGAGSVASIPQSGGVSAPAAVSVGGASVWIAVGSGQATSVADNANTAHALALLAFAVPADLPAGTTPPIGGPPLYVTSLTRESAQRLRASLAHAGLDPRVADLPPTMDVAARAIAAATLFPAASPGVIFDAGPRAAGAALGPAILLVRVAG